MWVNASSLLHFNHFVYNFRPMCMHPFAILTVLDVFTKSRTPLVLHLPHWRRPCVVLCVLKSISWVLRCKMSRSVRDRFDIVATYTQFGILLAAIVATAMVWKTHTQLQSDTYAVHISVEYISLIFFHVFLLFFICCAALPIFCYRALSLSSPSPLLSLSPFPSPSPSPFRSPSTLALIHNNM